ncbi:MAG: tyrosine-type recombinase/integrase [Anaerolineae bacterium]|nr:tyrosine-type recombinase/integrase [Anaerolineae bacterium]
MISQIETISTQNTPIDHNPAAVYLASLSPGGRRTMNQALDTIAGYLGSTGALGFPWSEIRYQHAAAIRQKLLEEYQPATVNKILSALRGVLKQAWLLGYMTAEDYHKAAAVKGANGQSLPSGRELSTGEIAAIMRDCEHDSSLIGARDAAIFAVLYSAGLRRAEIVALTLDDFDSVSGSLTVRGKGNKDRMAYLKNGAARALTDWIEIRGFQPGALFVPIAKGGKIQAGALTTQAIYNMLRKRAERAGVNNFSPHDLRRTFVSHLLSAGADISTVSKMAGHANVQTTMRYDRRGEDAKSQAAELLHVPYGGRKISE